MYLGELSTPQTEGENKQMERWFVYRDGAKVSEALSSEDACFEWLLKHQGQSVDHATKHEGYSWKREPSDGQS